MPSPTSNPAPIVATMKQAAKMLLVSERTLWTIVFQRKEIPAFQVGRQWRLRIADLQAYADRKCNEFKSVGNDEASKERAMSTSA